MKIKVSVGLVKNLADSGMILEEFG